MSTAVVHWHPWRSKFGRCGVGSGRDVHLPNTFHFSVVTCKKCIKLHAEWRATFSDIDRQVGVTVGLRIRGVMS